MSQLISINPSNNQILGKVKVSSTKEVHQKVQMARNASKAWKELGLAGRIKELKKVIRVLDKRKKEFAELASKEMGMPISQSTHDATGIVEYFNWNLENAEKYLSPEIVYEDKEMVHKVFYEPYGVAAVITPWNFPASNFAWMCIQNLIVGNTIVFKDSEAVPLCGRFIESVFEEAKLPKGVFSEVYGEGEVGNTLVHDDIDLICFTGSSNTGQRLYKIGAEKFIKVLLELGGSAPGIVFEDAKVDKIIDTIYANRFDNCGQICDGLKRLIVHSNKVDEVVAKLIAKLQTVRIGDAMDFKTDIGPLVSVKQLDALKEQVTDSLKRGARATYVKQVPNDLKGNYYPPTILTNINRAHKVWIEEVFGPVLPIVTFETEDQALELANDTKYGLGGYVFTEDEKRFERVASKIQTGMVMMNNAGYIQFSSPFGGCKISGMGREHGKFGFHELTQVKLVSHEK